MHTHTNTHTYTRTHMVYIRRSWAILARVTGPRLSRRTRRHSRMITRRFRVPLTSLRIMLTLTLTRFLFIV